MDDGHFDAQVAATYDEDSAEMFDPAILEPAVDLLAGLARDGRALEFAIGTGRVALPMAARGIDIAGIELSSAMVDALRAKPGGAHIPVVIGDMTSARVDGPFTLVYLVFNTIMNLTTQDAQVACFRNAAAHLEPGGAFVVEVMVPQLQRLPLGDTFQVFDASERHWGIDEYEVATQRLTSHHVSFVDGRTKLVSMPFRYAWPAELDLMAQLAGMRLRDRWASWSGAPFTDTSRSHVSVWELPAS